MSNRPILHERVYLALGVLLGALGVYAIVNQFELRDGLTPIFAGLILVSMALGTRARRQSGNENLTVFDWIAIIVAVLGTGLMISTWLEWI
ncbi:MAG: hypothetical protein AAGI08_08085 [Bacteroidota bacterium]